MNYPPYPPAGPPPKQGSSAQTTAIIVVAIIGFLLLLVGVPLVVGAVIGYTRASRAAASASAHVDPAAIALSVSFKAPNGLVTAHYPEDFVAKTLDDATIVLSRNFPSGEDEVMTIAGVHNPITNDAREFGRLLLGLVEKNIASKGGTSTKGQLRPAKCLGKYDGVEVDGEFSLPKSAPYVSWACFFFNGDKGYEVRYDVPKSRTTVEVPLLERILHATELTP